MKPARLKDIIAVLKAGGTLRMVWKDCRETLIHPDGTEQPVDGRSYSAFIHGPSMKKHGIKQTETGAVGEDNTNLVFEWRI